MRGGVGQAIPGAPHDEAVLSASPVSGNSYRFAEVVDRSDDFVASAAHRPNPIETRETAAYLERN